MKELKDRIEILTKEIYEFVDSITRIGIMNNQEKLENLKERIGKIEA